MICHLASPSDPLFARISRRGLARFRQEAGRKGLQAGLGGWAVSRPSPQAPLVSSIPLGYALSFGKSKFLSGLLNRKMAAPATATTLPFISHRWIQELLTP